MQLHAPDPMVSRIIERLLKDRSAHSLMAANAFTLIIALFQNWDLLTLMRIYWGQSVTIGLINFWRLWTLENFTTEGLTVNDRPVPPTSAGKRQVAIFFLFHYGIFHFVYMVFLSVGVPQNDGGILPQKWFILACVAGFAVNHAYSFLHNRERDRQRVLDLGKIIFFPYARILPMHLTIILGGVLAGGTRWALLLFLVLKMAADLIMHAMEHEMGHSPEPEEK